MDKIIAAKPDDTGSNNDDISDKLLRATWLLYDGIASGAQQRLKSETKEVAVELAGSALFGLALGAASHFPRKIPGLNRVILPALGIMFGADLLNRSIRSSLAVRDVIDDKSNYDTSKKVVAQQLGKGLVDYAALGLGGYAAARIGIRLAQPFADKYMTQSVEVVLGPRMNVAMTARTLGKSHSMPPEAATVRLLDKNALVVSLDLSPTMVSPTTPSPDHIRAMLMRMDEMELAISQRIVSTGPRLGINPFGNANPEPKFSSSITLPMERGVTLPMGHSVNPTQLRNKLSLKSAALISAGGLSLENTKSLVRE